MTFTGSLLNIKENLKNYSRKESDYPLDKQDAIQMLNQALATEIVCVLRYKQNWCDADGLESGPVSEEFFKHAQEEEQHANRIANRISELGAKPNFSPDALHHAHVTFRREENLLDMIEENLRAERVAIAIYREMIEYFGHKDSTTRRMLEDILAEEEHHADEMNTLRRSALSSVH